MAVFKFSVDSALLKELGERLVGKPHIALAELVKNGFDADATNVAIQLEGDAIIVADNGHGMTRDEFQDYWMRIGSPHKAEQGFSRTFKRPLTGSKGVGRLSGQFLARRMTIHTVAQADTVHEFIGNVNWDDAIRAPDLTKAEVVYKYGLRRTLFPGNSEHGTKITLHRLNQTWEEENIRDLAREIWLLQPPFRTNPRLESEKARSFTVTFESEKKELAESFEAQMKAILGLYYVRITGELIKLRSNGIGEVQLALEWEDGPIVRQVYQVPDCRLHKFDFEIRVYHLLRRQKQGVPVQEARDYLNQFGGVHIYDSGFHLPYYGPEEDWLHTELDHSHRLSASKLLPEELQVSHGLNYLPTMSRLLGVVNVDTGAEAREAAKSKTSREGKHLMIQITRDRLVDNEAFQNLAFAVRWALDFYAMREATREFEKKKAKARTEPAKEKFERAEQAVEQFKDQIEAHAYNQIRRAVREAVVLADEEQEERIRQANLLGVLATAGMSAVAFRHEFTKQLTILRALIDQLRKVDLKSVHGAARLAKITGELESWQRHVKANQSLFLGIADAENRETRFRPKAREIADSTRRQLEALLGNLPVEIDKIDSDLRLPQGTFAEWSAILQNILTNAANALLDSLKPKIVISSRRRGRSQELIIEDNGKGVDLSNSEELFKPFVRKLKLSREREAMGMGGTGLGLTIVRMLAENLECRVSFVEPQPGFKTALRIAWSEAT